MEDVINDLKKIKSETLKRRAMIRILKKAARPIVLAERQALSPSKGIETGLLKKSLGSWTYPKGRNGDFTMVGVSARVKSGKFQKVAKVIKKPMQFYLSNIKRDAFSKAIKSSKGFKAGAMAGRKKATDFK